MNTYLILAFFIVCAFSQSYCGTTDLACAKAKKTMLIKTDEIKSTYPQASFEIPTDQSTTETCKSDKKTKTAVPFPMSFAYTAAEVASIAITDEVPGFEGYFLSTQMLLDGLAAKYQSEEASLFATFDLEDAFNYIMESGLCTSEGYEEPRNLLPPSITRFEGRPTCEIYKIEGYEHITGTVKDILNRFGTGPIAVSLMIGQDQTDITYPESSTGELTSIVDMARGWEDRAEGDQRCDGTGCYHNDISAWSTTTSFTPTFTYFGRMIGYSISDGEPESWTMDTCVYRRNAVTYSDLKIYNSLNHFRGEYETSNQGTDTGFITYGVYQPYYQKNKCVVDPVDVSIVLTDDEEQFMDEHNLNYCTLAGVNEYTFIGLTDDSLPMVKNILNYIFANNKINTSGKWDNLKTLSFVGLQSKPANQLTNNDENTGLLLNIKDLLSEDASITTKFPEFQLETTRRLSETNVDANTHLRA